MYLWIGLFLLAVVIVLVWRAMKQHQRKEALSSKYKYDPSGGHGGDDPDEEAKEY